LLFNSQKHQEILKIFVYICVGVLFQWAPIDEQRICRQSIPVFAF